MTLIQFINGIENDNSFDFEMAFDLLTSYDKGIILSLLGGFLTATCDFAHDKNYGFKFAFVVLKSRLRMSQINNKLL